MSACCRRRSSVSMSLRCAKARPRRSRRCWRTSPRTRCRQRSAPRLSIALAQQNGKTISAVMAYADRLEKFVKWYVQLWAESLGKDGKGTTPIGALGPVDQHSQLQLFIAGPRDKLFTVITTDVAGQGARDRSRTSRRAPESRTSPAGPSAIWLPRRAVPPPRRWRRMACRSAPSISRPSTRRVARRTA